MQPLDSIIQFVYFGKKWGMQIVKWWGDCGTFGDCGKEMWVARVDFYLAEKQKTAVKKVCVTCCGFAAEAPMLVVAP